MGPLGRPNRRTQRGEIYSVREMRPTAREFELMRSFGPAARLRSQNKFAATINYRPVRGAVSKSKGERERERRVFPLTGTDMLRYPAHLRKRHKNRVVLDKERGEVKKKREKINKYLLWPRADKTVVETL